LRRFSCSQPYSCSKAEAPLTAAELLDSLSQPTPSPSDVGDGVLDVPPSDETPPTEEIPVGIKDIVEEL
jgi:hypothetical protein